MGDGGERAGARAPLKVSNARLADALQTADIAAVAFALRHGPTVVPLAASDHDPVDDGVWTYRDPLSEAVVLLLFSDAARIPTSLPPAAALLSPAALRAVLDVRPDIAVIYFDIAGPHPMQAPPAEILKALDA